ncbi:hypothetical protein L873DRAFT_1867112 [Choiromyces venosus 120613-1]|uniref:Uncharacterized protein n=1 Tax=Choiromyces venosus 120613-1 TaxID=1336337 RepID=A0A3N4K0I3_9PEZI|nr:hypothetical protein L873DRAFT_1867112 [Choiromyces venosus 120613-1]
MDKIFCNASATGSNAVTSSTSQLSTQRNWPEQMTDEEEEQSIESNKVDDHTSSEIQYGPSPDWYEGEITYYINNAKTNANSDTLELEYLEDLWRSMPSRVCVVIAANGWYTKY